MTFSAPPENLDVWIGFGLFVLSELIGMSKAKDNSLLQLVLHMASELFPYEVRRREAPTRSNRPRRARDSRGRFSGQD
jgi:hypothetical protein